MSTVARSRAQRARSGKERTGISILNVGISRAGVCGVRDYSQVLSDALARLGSDVQTEWLDTEPSWGPRRLRTETGRWLDRIEDDVELVQPDWILWHYSVFSYSHRGVPILSGISSARLAATHVPVVGVLHEFVYPFGQFSPRGLVYPVAQRAALRPVYRRLTAAVVTTDSRAEWLESRRWLSVRPVFSLPVCATTPLPDSFGLTLEDGEPIVGIVGFASEGYLVEAVIEAVRLAVQSRPIRLLLIGAPGAQSAQGEKWRVAAKRAGIAELLRFTGLLEPSEYAAAIASVQMVVFPDASGPSSRKTTLAAALAAGKPVVAIDGPARWDLLANEHSVLLVPPDPQRIADAILHLSQDRGFRLEQGHRAERFYRRHQAPEVIADRLIDLLAESI